MTDYDATLESLARVAKQADLLRARASDSLRTAVGRAAEQGMTQKQIGQAIGRSQPEVSRLIKEYRARKFRPSSATGRQIVRCRDEIERLARKHRAHNVRVFGSVARGDDGKHSDVDLLVDLEPGADLLDLAGLEVELERLLGRPVDLMPVRLLRPRVAASAINDAATL